MAGIPPLLRTARRVTPVALALYRRWERLPPERKEHYRRMARENIERGRRGASDVWARGRGR